MRYFFLILGLTVLGVMLIAGKRGDTSRQPPIFIFPDMDRQAKLRPQKEYSFFGDLRSSRLPVAHTVARGQPFENSPANTGRTANTTNYVENIPVPVTEQMLARGRERFAIYCAPCHSPLGDGKSIANKFGLAIVANLHDARIVKMADGELFNTISNGKNNMLGYASQIDISDRWAIIAYLRALQRSRLGSVDDVPEGERARFQ